MANTFKSGKSGTATFGGSSLAITGWTYEEMTEIVRYRNSGTAGGTVKEGTFEDARGRVSADFDIDTNYFATGPTIRAGTTGSVVLSDGTNPITLSVIISRVIKQLVLEGKITFEFEYETTGSTSFS